MKIKLNELIKEYRLKAGLTQLELSKLLGLETMQFVHLMEKGTSKIPLRTLGKLVVLLNLPEKQILKAVVKAEIDHINEEVKVGKLNVTKPSRPS